MRNRRYRPRVEGLDFRLLLSDVTPGLPGSGMQGLPPGSMPGDEIDPTVIVPIYGSGDPPADTTDPMNPVIDPTDPTGPSNTSATAPTTTTTIQSPSTTT